MGPRLRLDAKVKRKILVPAWKEASDVVPNYWLQFNVQSCTKLHHRLSAWSRMEWLALQTTVPRTRKAKC